jgi:hypothetical protein
MTARLSCLVLGVLLVAARPVRAQRFIYSGVADSTVLSFVGRLQQAVGAGDRAAVAGMIRYPLRVNHDAQHHINVASAAELMKQYDAVFTPSIRQGIVKQLPATLTGGHDGVAIDGGRVWVGSACDKSQPPKCKLGVTSVNLHGEK